MHNHDAKGENKKLKLIAPSLLDKIVMDKILGSVLEIERANQKEN